MSHNLSESDCENCENHSFIWIILNRILEETLPPDELEILFHFLEHLNSNFGNILNSEIKDQGTSLSPLFYLASEMKSENYINKGSYFNFSLVYFLIMK